MAARPTFYITTAISYPNGAPHIGHAYEAVATDAIARFKRLDGYDVFFMTGVDEHGLKMTQTAAKLGLTPKELSDRNTELFVAMCDSLGVSYDRFIRTTEPAHFASSQELWRRMEEAGDIYLDTYAGWYSVRDEAFYDESETTLADGGQRLGPQGTPVEWTEENTYFFRLAKYQDRLLELYERVPDFVGPESRRNEVISFVRGGLQDLSISRTTLTWGIPVPQAPGHVMYVWVDALTNYITGLGFPDEAAPRWRYWPADVHIIGKDITRFHTVYWPAFLMSAGIEVPRRVYGHGFLLSRGEKMSKSAGNVVGPQDLVAAYGTDQLRYFFLREVPFGQDGNYSHETIVGRINADLANDLGNLAQRSLSMVARNCAGRVPARGADGAAERALLEAADGLLSKARAALQNFAIHTILADIWAVVADANRYFAAQEPWTLRKTDPSRMETVLYVTAEVLRNVAILAQPVTPEAAGKLLDLLAVPAEARDFAHLGEAGRLVPGTELPPPQPIFPRYVEPEAETAP
ncbi:methionine--tRNA ligase [Chelatococcus reniformis]|uniref:Methionine--tRNA ligase n=1 Tax=Chelatococcus reniformis TaxID=1494448 RepID=A0A916U1N2_9HYPH|nr:methionine--tRNA ligase [Chelatococcus reniformis]GGC56633.1 methionine--tRNA ligase [Chelatococcus reniformis]